MKRLLILSGKGGTGKTTTAAAFLRFARARAAADCDVDAPNLHLVTEQTVSPAVSDFMGGDKAAVDPEKCIGCGTCLAHCRFGALRAVAGCVQVNEYACEGCGVCVQVCPRGRPPYIRIRRAGKSSIWTRAGRYSPPPPCGWDGATPVSW